MTKRQREQSKAIRERFGIAIKSYVVIRVEIDRLIRRERARMNKLIADVQKTA